jgi:hypothetical protein
MICAGPSPRKAILDKAERGVRLLLATRIADAIPVLLNVVTDNERLSAKQHGELSPRQPALNRIRKTLPESRHQEAMSVASGLTWADVWRITYRTNLISTVT